MHEDQLKMLTHLVIGLRADVDNAFHSRLNINQTFAALSQLDARVQALEAFITVLATTPSTPRITTTQDLADVCEALIPSILDAIDRRSRGPTIDQSV